MSRQRAFTLVEMLLVAALIVLLISLLLPALGRARETAERNECGVNLRQQGAGLAQYSVEHVSRLPVYDPNAAGGPNDHIRDPVLTYRVGAAPGDATAGDITVRNHGVLYEQGYLTSPDLYYCPNQRGGIWQRELYAEPWLSGGSRGHLGGQEVSGSTWLVRSAYLFSPHRRVGDDRRAHQRLAGFPNDHVLMMDLLFASQFYDTVAHDKDTAWNIMHPDLSVSVHRNNWVFQEIARYPRLYWPEFEPVLTALLNGRE